MYYFLFKLFDFISEKLNNFVAFLWQKHYEKNIKYRRL